MPREAFIGPSRPSSLGAIENRGIYKLISGYRAGRREAAGLLYAGCASQNRRYRQDDEGICLASNVKIGVVDTTFSTVDMGAIALDELKKSFPNARVIRRTVPGFKDLAVECQRLLKNDGCDIALALGMVGAAPIDTQCAHEASIGIQMAKMNTNKHIVEVFVHVNEAVRKDGSIDEADLLALCEDRTRKHVHNAVWLVTDPEQLVKRAGTGRRQGRADVGGVNKK